MTIITGSQIGSSGGGEGGVPEAPEDGEIYGRKDTTWVVVPDAGAAMVWGSEWEADQVPYAANTLAKDEGFVGVSKVSTSHRLAPQPEGLPTYNLPEDGTGFTTLSNTSVVYSGHTYTFTEGGWLQRIRVWVSQLTDDTNYRILLVDETAPATPKVTIITTPVLVEDGWAIVAVDNIIIQPGSVLRVVLDGLNSGSETEFSGGWSSGGEDNNNAPSLQSWNRNTQNSLIRIDDTDLDSIDRTTELNGVTVDSTIQIVQTNDITKFFTYTVIATPVDQGGYVEYSVVTSNSGNGGPTTGQATTITATIPIAQSTEYSEINDFWLANQPTYASVVGFLEFDGVVQAGHEDDAYGVDLQFQKAEISVDWDYLPIGTGTGLSGSTDSFNDGQFGIYSASDTTKVTKFDSSGITTGTTRVLSTPDADGTLVITEGNQTLNGEKTFTEDSTFNAGIIAPNIPGATGDAGVRYNTATGALSYDGAATITTSPRLVWSTDTTATDPGAGVVKGDNADLSLITELYISSSSSNGFSFGEIMSDISLGDYFSIIVDTNQVNQLLLHVESAATDNTGWWTVPVTASSSGGSLTDGIEVTTDFIPTSSRTGNLRIVRSLEDLPAPIGGIIDLPDGYKYLQVAPINTGTNRIRFGDSRYSGLGTNVEGLTYTGTGAAFLCTGDSTLDNLAISCVNGSPLSWTTTGISTLRWTDCTISECESCGDFTANGGAVRLGSVTFRNIKTTGFTLTGNFNVFRYVSAGIFLNAGDVFDITGATFNTSFNTSLISVVVFPVGATYIRGLAADANFPGEGKGLVSDCNMGSDGTPLVGVSEGDIKWDFINSAPIQDSSKTADIYLSAPTTTTIDTEEVFEPVDGGNWVSDVLQRFTTNTDGTLTYVGAGSSNFLIVATMTLDKVGGGSDEIAGGIAINNVATGGAFMKTISSTDNSSPTSITCVRVVRLSTGDLVNTYVANLDGTSNVTVSRANISLINGF